MRMKKVVIQQILLILFFDCSMSILKNMLYKFVFLKTSNNKEATMLFLLGGGLGFIDYRLVFMKKRAKVGEKSTLE